MSDMRLPPLPQGTRRAHTVWTLSVRVAHMSPSSSGAGVRLSLLEGDCVGPTRPILKAGLSRARLFSLPVSPKTSVLFHHEKGVHSVDSGTNAPHHPAHVHEFVRPPRRHEKSFPFGGFGRSEER